MKFFLPICLLIGISISSFAQSGSKTGKLNVGAEVAMPIGNYTDVYKVGFGASLKYEIPTTTNLFVTLSAGYMHFGYSNFTKYELDINGGNGASGVSYIPLKAGLKYYAEDGLFIEGQVGGAFNTARGGGSAFAFSPGGGYSFDSGFEAGIRYESWSKNGTFDQFAIRLAYRF